MLTWYLFWFTGNPHVHVPDDSSRLSRSSIKQAIYSHVGLKFGFMGFSKKNRYFRAQKVPNSFWKILFTPDYTNQYEDNNTMFWRIFGNIYFGGNFVFVVWPLALVWIEDTYQTIIHPYLHSCCTILRPRCYPSRKFLLELDLIISCHHKNPTLNRCVVHSVTLPSKATYFFLVLHNRGAFFVENGIDGQAKTEDS